jgi:hypothetical protein
MIKFLIRLRSELDQFQVNFFKNPNKALEQIDRTVKLNQV